MAEIFKRTALNFGGGFSASQGILTLGATALTPVLAQDLAIDFSQQLTRLYELADGVSPVSVYELGGRAQGNVTLGRIIGPGVLLEQFYSTYGDICQAPNNTINTTIQPGCAGNAVALNYFLRYCLLTKVNVGVQAHDLLVNENTQMRYSVLEHTSNPSLPAAPNPGPAPP